MHFQAEHNHEQQWLRTLIEVPDKTKPFYQLYTGGVNRRFKFSSNASTVFWGCIVDDYAGVWLLRNSTTWEHPVIAPITSANIESYKSLESHEKTCLQHYEYWANFFAQALIHSDYSLLTQGKWQIEAGSLVSHSKRQKPFIINPALVYEDNGVFVDQLHFIDWGINGSGELIATKHQPADDSARVKWWRKKVRENACPPVLVWYVNPLNAYLIIDGHSRLRAYQLEDQPVQLLVLCAYQIQTQKAEHVLEMRQNMFRSLKHRLDNERKNKRKHLSIDDINQILIQMYDNKYEVSITQAKPIANLDDIWESEVNQFLTDTSINQHYLEGLINGVE